MDWKDGKIGFVGLGIMGRPMAKNLLKAGYGIIACDIVKAATDELAAAGAEIASTPAAVAAACNGVLITMLPNSPQVKEVVCGKGGVLESAKAGLIIVDMSSISPIASREIAAEAAGKGVVYLDCPVSGGEPKAVDGTLSIMAGGDESAFAAVKELLLVMGSSAVLVGGIGSGNMTKLANQIIVAVNISAVAEALTLAAKAGVDPQKVYEAIRGGLAGSTVLDAKAPMMMAHNFKPGFRIALHIKDLNNVMDAASATGAQVPLSSEVLGFMEKLRAGGHDGDDHSGLLRYYEELSDITL